MEESYSPRVEKDENELRGRIVVKYLIPGPLYLDLQSRPQGFGAVVKALRRENRQKGIAESAGVMENDLLLSVGQCDVTTVPFERIISLVRGATFPLTLYFLSTTRDEFGQHDDEDDDHDEGYNMQRTKKQHHLKKRRSFDKPKAIANELFRKRPEGKKWTKYSIKDIVLGKKSVEKQCDELKQVLNSLEWREQTPCHTVPLQVFSPSHSELLVENIDNIELIWYKSVYGKMHTISGVTGLRYQPSVDDIGAKICVHVRAVPFEALLKTLEVGPLQMDPAIQDLVQAMMESGTGTFSATLASSELDSFQIRVDPKRVVLVSVNQNDANSGVVKAALYSANIQVMLHASDECGFTLRFQPTGWTLGNDGDVCDITADFSCLSAVHLKAFNATNRDLIAQLIRTYRSTCISVGDEEIAIGYELKLDGIVKILQEKEHENSIIPEKTSPLQHGSISPGRKLHIGTIETELPEHEMIDSYQSEIVTYREKVTSLEERIALLLTEKSHLQTAVSVRENRLVEIKTQCTTWKEQCSALEDETKYFRPFKASSIRLENTQAILVQERDDSYLVQLELRDKITELLQIQTTSTSRITQLETKQKEIISQLNESQEVVVVRTSEGNALRTKVDALRKELRRVVTIPTVTKEDSHTVQIQLALSKAHGKQIEDELRDAHEAITTLRLEVQGSNKSADVERLTLRNRELHRLTEVLTRRLADI